MILHCDHQERVLQAVGRAGFDSARAKIEPVGAGLNNSNWFVEAGAASLFVKLYENESPAEFRRNAAIEASRLAGTIGIGPRLMANFSDIGAEVFERLKGYSPSSAEQFEDAGFRTGLLARYRRFHSAPALSETRTGMEQLDERVAGARGAALILPSDFPVLLAHCEEACRALSKLTIRLVPCHNDSHFPNFMVNANGDMKIVDWEYASNNDPCWDLTGMIFSSQRTDLLEPVVAEYFGSADELYCARIRLYLGVMGVSWGIWSAMQARSGTPDFDFQAYSAELFSRARRFMEPEIWRPALIGAVI